MELVSVATPIHWFGFIIGVCLLIGIDLGVFNRRAQTVSLRNALAWSCAWIGLSLAFNVYIYLHIGQKAALEFLSAYIIEKALSVDNIFVFVVIFRYLKIPRTHLHRVLFAGIFGALGLRALFIFTGLTLIELFRWSLYGFGGFLFYTGLKILFFDQDPSEEPGECDEAPPAASQDNIVKRLAERYLPLTKLGATPQFMVREDGVLRFTPLFVALLMVETADVVFALDSIPAIFGITQDPFIVFTSNICAILGLRSLFFVLENLVHRFRYLQTGLGVILALVGLKMIFAEGLGGMGLYQAGVAKSPWLDPVHVPITWSLAMVLAVLFISVLASLLIAPKR